MIKFTLNIEGMACNMCEAHIQDAIRRNFNIKSVKANHKKAIAEVISENELDENRLKQAIEIIRNRYTAGIFQLESAGMRNAIKTIKPTCFDDIIAMVALYRP